MMGEISDLESRINSALDRISAGLDGLEPPAPVTPAADPEELKKMQSELNVSQLEKTALQDKIEDLLAAHDRHTSEHAAQLEAQGGQLAAQQAQIDAQASQMQDLDETLQRLRHANAQLRENNNALRQANEQGVGDPHLINTAMLAELEGLRSTQAADKAEADAIIGTLRPLLNAGQDN